MGIRTRIVRWFDVDSLVRARIDSLESDLVASRATTAEHMARIEKLEKRLGMAMGAIQAATAQIMTVKQTAEGAQSTAAKAVQTATSALSTAEAAADGVTALEA